MGSTFYGYVDPMERAHELIEERLAEEYGDGLERMLKTGLEDEAKELLLAVADALETAGGFLIEQFSDSGTELAEWIRKCVEERNFEEVFDY